MACYDELLTSHKVLARIIFVVSHYDLSPADVVLLVLIDQLHKLFVLGDTARGGLGRSNYSLCIVNHAVMFVTRPRLTAALAHASRIRIASAHHPIIDRLVTLRCARLFQFAFRRSIP